MIYPWQYLFYHGAVWVCPYRMNAGQSVPRISQKQPFLIESLLTAAAASVPLAIGRDIWRCHWAAWSTGLLARGAGLLTWGARLLAGSAGLLTRGARLVAGSARRSIILCRQCHGGVTVAGRQNGILNHLAAATSRGCVAAAHRFRVTVAIFDGRAFRHGCGAAALLLRHTARSRAAPARRRYGLGRRHRHRFRCCNHVGGIAAFVKAGVKRIIVFRVQVILHDPQAFPETDGLKQKMWRPLIVQYLYCAGPQRGGESF